MVSRRRFLQAGSITAGVALAAVPSALQAEEACAPLPPSIASLKSMKDLAKPIAVDERAARQEKARQLMAADHLDAILLADGTSLEYFAGVHWWGSERLFALVLPTKGRALCVCPAFEEGRARELLANSPEGKKADVRTWQEDQSPYQVLAQGLTDLKISTGRLGMEETVRFVFSDKIAKAMPRLQIVSATPVTAGCRMIKSEHELELMRLANQVTLTAYRAAHETLHDGMPQAELERHDHGRIRTTGVSRRGRHRDRREFLIPARLGCSPGDSRRFTDHAGRRLHRRGISIRHYSYVRIRQTFRQDEAGV